MAEQVEAGDNVSWGWNGSKPEGQASEVKEGEVTVTSKRGNEISETGDASDPAVHIERSGNDVVKLASELDIEKKANGEGTVQSNGHTVEAKEEQKKEDKAGGEVKSNEEEQTNGEEKSTEEGQANGEKRSNQEERTDREEKSNGKDKLNDEEEVHDQEKPDENTANEGKKAENGNETAKEDEKDAKVKDADERSKDASKDDEKKEPKEKSRNKRKAEEVEEDETKDVAGAEGKEADSGSLKKQKTTNGTAKATNAPKRGPGRPRGATTAKKEKTDKQAPAAGARSLRKTRSQGAAQGE